MRKSIENTLRLKAIADEQFGYFTAAQARLAGYASQQHVFHCSTGNWIRIKRGVFRLHGYADSNESELAKWCLICRDRTGQSMATISHESALIYYGLLDIPPQDTTFTVPSGFRKRIPEGCILKHGALKEGELVSKGAISVTSPIRTLKDLISVVDDNTLKELAGKALAKGLVTFADLADAGLREGLAPSVSSGSGQALGLLVMQSDGHLFGEIRRHLVDFLQSNGIVSALIDPKEGGEPLIVRFERALRFKPSSIVIGGENLLDDHFRSYLIERQESLPRLVFLNMSERDFRISASFIKIDYWRAAYDATRWLISQGRKNIALHSYKWMYFQEDYRDSISYEFSQGWSMALEEAGLPYNKKFIDIKDEEDNERRFLEFISSPDRPDAILADADFRIGRRIGTIRKVNLRIPEDLMIVGCNNTPWSVHPDCSFPSISLREKEIARLAAEIMSGTQEKHSVMTVTPELIVRGVPGTSLPQKSS